MISLFENVSAPLHGLPFELMSRGGRGIELLEFVSCDAQPQLPAESHAAGEREHAADAAIHQRALQVAAMVDAARDEAAAAMKAACDAEMEVRVNAERMRLDRVCAAFAEDRQRYFAAAEEQVVRLALAIARRVLAREVAADAMHMAATVRAALARLQDGSRPVLRVHAEEAAAWAVLLGDEADVVGDVRVPPGECVLESRVGRVELGVRPQVQEIERGFAELAEREAA